MLGIVMDMDQFEKLILTTLRSMLSSNSKSCRDTLFSELEGPNGWSPPTTIMDKYQNAIEVCSRELGKPWQVGAGPRHYNYDDSVKIDPTPDDFLRIGDICCWKNEQITAYLSVTTHDADTLRCLNLEVVRKVCSSKMEDQIRKWTERAEIARKQGQEDLVAAALALVSICQALSKPQTEADKPDVLIKANHLRKQIEASEKHRTMCVEHGLSDAAIDATYEIQGLEKELVALVQCDQKRDDLSTG